VWRRLSQSIAGRPAWQEALIVGVAVAITLTGLLIASGKHLGAAVGLGMAGGIESALGSGVGKRLRVRRRARRLRSN
jgi:hypothetical protein